MLTIRTLPFLCSQQKVTIDLSGGKQIKFYLTCTLPYSGRYHCIDNLSLV